MHPDFDANAAPFDPGRRRDPDGTRRRHDFWRHVVGPHLDDRAAGRQRRCLEPAGR